MLRLILFPLRGICNPAFVVLFLFPIFVSAQSSADSTLSLYKDTFNLLAKKMHRGENDSVRHAAAAQFQQLVENILKDTTSFHASFDSVKSISAKTAPDNTFRLYTWTWPNNDGSHYYHAGYMQTYNAKTKKTSLFALHDSSDVIEKPKSTKLKPERWYGAVYYSILKNVKDKKNYYTLLGWHGRNSAVTQKLADVLYFDKGNPVFGYPLFKTGKVYSHRVIFEYVAQAVMTLKYDESRKLLVFDHLSKVGPFFGPDGSYDAFRFSKEGRWELIEDVDVDAGFKPKTPPQPVPDHLLQEKEKEMKK